MLHSVFISYSRSDLKQVDDIVAAVESLRIPVWVDRRDIPVTVPWFEEVQAAIEAAALLVVCDSPRWRASEACRLELEVARKKHKVVCTVDLTAMPVPDIVRQIAETYGAISPQQRVHTEVTARAAMWDRQNRTSSRLIVGDLLARARRLMQEGVPPLNMTARDFIVASTRRRRRRRWTAGAGIAAGLAVMLISCLGVGVAGLINDRLDQNDTYFHVLAADDQAVGATLYDEIALAADRVREGNTGWLDRQRLARLLAEPVPDVSFEAPQRLIGLAATANPDRAAGIGTDGRHYMRDGSSASVGTPAGQRFTVAATSRDGGTMVALTGPQALITSGGNAVRAGRADRVAVAVNGETVLAVAVNGETVLAVGGGTARLLRPDGAVHAMTSIPDGCCTAAATVGDWSLLGSRDGSLRWWRPGERPAIRWKSPKGAVSGLAVAPDGRSAAVTLANDGLVRTFDVTDRQVVPRRALPVPGAAGPISFSPDGRLLAAGTRDGVAVFDLGSGLRIGLLRGSVGEVRHLAWSPAGERIWALAGERRVSSWHWRAGTVITNAPGRKFVALSGPPGADWLAAVDGTGRISILDTSAARVLRSFAVDIGRVLSADVSQDGNFLVLGSDSRLVVHGLADGTERGFAADGCTAIDVAIGGDGRRVYVACLDGGVRAYDISSGRLLLSGDVDGRQEISLALGADGTVYVGDGIGEIHAFAADLSVPERLVTAACGHPAWQVAAGTSGELVVLARDGAAHLGCSYEVHRRVGGWQRVLFQQPPGDGESARAVALASDESLAAMGFSDGRVHVWRPGALETVGTYHQFGAEVRALRFTPDGHQLLVATSDGVVQILPSCPQCGEVTQLAEQAGNLLKAAAAKGLHAR
ncbi:TIR domain-containing protein [Micromonospora aurantiaca (nom. illeg.)]|uniref:WD40 domain-containing protein n=1 Tax=Micromonospora aurantiaca (nom. illeg.) TaxID=47850 RepID=UPI00342532CB